MYILNILYLTLNKNALGCVCACVRVFGIENGKETSDKKTCVSNKLICKMRILQDKKCYETRSQSCALRYQR